jgi:uncharacterized protein with PIN domain
MEVLDEWVIWNIILVRLEIVLVLTQDRCAVCAKHTIGTEIVLMHPMEVLDEWVIWNIILVRLETVLLSAQYRCTVCAECTIGSEIVLDAPDDTPG